MNAEGKIESMAIDNQHGMKSYKAAKKQNWLFCLL